MKIRPSFTTRQLLLAMTVVCALLTAWRGLVHYVTWYASAPGEIVASNEWPFRVRQLVNKLEVAGSPTGARVYEFGYGPWFFDSQYAWKITLPPEHLDLAVEELKLTLAPADQPTPEAFRLWYPFWWAGTVDAESQLYANDFVPDDPGYASSYFAVYEAKAHSLRVWQIMTWD